MFVFLPISTAVLVPGQFSEMLCGIGKGRAWHGMGVSGRGENITEWLGKSLLGTVLGC